MLLATELFLTVEEETLQRNYNEWFGLTLEVIIIERNLQKENTLLVPTKKLYYLGTDMRGWLTQEGFICVDRPQKRTLIMWGKSNYEKDA